MHSQPLLKGLLSAKEQVQQCCSLHCALASGTAPYLGTVDSLWPLLRSKELWGESKHHDFISHSAQETSPDWAAPIKPARTTRALYGIYTVCIIYAGDGAKKAALMTKFQPQRQRGILEYKPGKPILLHTCRNRCVWVSECVWEYVLDDSHANSAIRLAQSIGGIVTWTCTKNEANCSLK